MPPKAASQKVAGKPKPRQKKANGYKFPEKLPLGEVLRDTAKKEWKLGTSIGQGGFGEIYSASPLNDSAKNDYVIKIEPHENGPLFVERNFYIKIAKLEDVEAWKKANGLKVLGIPGFYGSGSHEYKKEKYRFIVIERYGKDLWNIFLSKNKKFPPAVVYKCALQIIDILHYIHSKGYIHGDIKGANLLIGLRKGIEHNVFLVDFGLACKYNTKEFKKDPKKAHNGTIEYTSRDWHIGVPTRRGDMEILGFNLLHWLGSTLPWETDIKDPERVHQKKKDFMENIPTSMKRVYPHVPKVIGQFLEYVAKLEPDEAPDYNFCKGLFLKELKNCPGNTNGKLDFGVSTDEILGTPKKTPKRGRKSLNGGNNETPKKTPQGKRKAVEEYNSGYDSGDLFEDTPTPKKVPKKTRKKPAEEAPTKANCFDDPPKEEDYETAQKPTSSKNGRAKKKDETSKPSWRDAPLFDLPKEEDDRNVRIPTTSKGGRAKKKDDTSKPSWHDAPHIDLPKEEDDGKVKKQSISRAKKKDESSKPSWRDAPAIKASNVSRPGEYSKKK